MDTCLHTFCQCVTGSLQGVYEINGSFLCRLQPVELSSEMIYGNYGDDDDNNNDSV